jgi:hypothetical protein
MTAAADGDCVRGSARRKPASHGDLLLCVQRMAWTSMPRVTVEESLRRYWPISLRLTNATSCHFELMNPYRSLRIYGLFSETLRSSAGSWTHSSFRVSTGHRIGPGGGRQTRSALWRPRKRRDTRFHSSISSRLSSPIHI